MTTPFPSDVTIRARLYRRPFARPLITSHGEWSVREGWLLRAEHNGKIAFGEVAPIPWLGSESMASAAVTIAAINSGASLDAIDLSDKPALLSGFSMALLSLSLPTPASVKAPLALLLDRTFLAPEAAPQLQALGTATVKLKLLSEDAATTITALIKDNPRLTFRLDANGGLSYHQSTTLLETLTSLPNFAYLEQPLPPSDTEPLALLSKRFPGKVALDESITGLESLKRTYASSPEAIFILKPLLVGNWRALLDWRQSAGSAATIMISSAMETYPSRLACAWLGSILQTTLPYGLGVSQYFTDELTNNYQTGLDASWPCTDNYIPLWETLGQHG